MSTDLGILVYLKLRDVEAFLKVIDNAQQFNDPKLSFANDILTLDTKWLQAIHPSWWDLYDHFVDLTNMVEEMKKAVEDHYHDEYVKATR